MEVKMTQLKSILNHLFTKKSLATGLTLALLLVGAVSFLAAAGDASKDKNKDKDIDNGRGYLGVYPERMSKDDRDEFGVKFGVLVKRVVKDGPAEKAGIKKYDVIQYINDEMIRRTDDLIDSVRQYKPGTGVEVKLVRDGKEKTVTAKLGKAKYHDYSFNLGDRKGNIFTLRKGGYLGVQLQKLNGDLAGYFGVKADEGALIMDVSKDSPAEKAGLKAGDVILEVEKEKVSGPDDVVKALRDFEEGDEVSVEIMRHNKKKTVKAELGAARGFGDIRILRGPGGKGYFDMKDFNFPMPRIEADGEHHILKDKIRTEMRSKELEKKLKEVRERLNTVGEDVHKKLKRVKEYIYI